MSQSAKIVIIQKNIPLAAKLSIKLNRLGYRITGIFSRAIDALSFIEQELPDIILLDENLKGQLNGMESAKKNSASVVYFNKNFWNSAKNIQKSLAVKSSSGKSTVSKRNEKVSQVNQLQKFTLNDRIFVRAQNTMVKISIDDIQYIEAERSYCRIFAKNCQYLLVMSLKDLNAKLPEDKFLRIHRSYIVNLSHINEIGNTHLVVASRVLPFSKSTRTELFQHLQVI